MTSVPDLIAAQRRQLADTLDALPDAMWEAPTLCDEWAVRNVVAHLVMPFRYSVPRFILGVLAERGNFTRFSNKVAQRDGRLPAEQLVTTLRANADTPYRPPGGGFAGALTDLVVHSLDICRPLGIDANLDPAAASAVLTHLTTDRSLAHFDLDLQGLRLEARDIEWTHGRGTVVAAPAEDLILALAKRRGPIDLTDSRLRSESTS